MLLDGATPRNVSRALSGINAFAWEEDLKPMARQALKELLENRLDQEMAENLGGSRYEHATEAYWRFSCRWRKAYPKAVKKDFDQLLSFFQIKNYHLVEPVEKPPT